MLFRSAGLGTASVREGGATVGALVAANPAGDVIGADGTVLAGSRAPAGVPGFPVPTPFENTTLVVVATDARVGKNECALLAQSAHDGLAQAIRPAHTRYDGDFAAVLATGEVEAHPDRLRVAATSPHSISVTLSSRCSSSPRSWISCIRSRR